MDTNKTALERAFEIARSGDCGGTQQLVKRLNREGYNGHQIEGQQLKRQLLLLIKEAKNTHADRT